MPPIDTQQLPGAAYALLLVGVVIGYCLDEARLMWRKVMEERRREECFAAKVSRMPRGGRS